MDQSAKIYVAGHTGLIGSALVCRLRELGYSNLVVRSHRQLDLSRQSDVEQFFAAEQPEYVFLAAAKVGGILANSKHPAEFINVNTLIQANIIDSAYKNKVKRLLFLGSSCIYPKHAPQPMKEEYLLTGPLEPTNRAYSVAKISGIEMCWSYNKEYGTRFVAAMPTNLYGPGDNYDLQESHVLPALVRKMHEAKIARADHVTIWGTGSPRREFLYSEDAAEGCIYIMNLPDATVERIAFNEEVAPILNVGCGEDLTIRELAELVSDVIGFRKRLVFDHSKPDGAPQKLLDVSRLESLGWKSRTKLRDGVTKTYEDFLGQPPSARVLREEATALEK